MGMSYGFMPQVWCSKMFFEHRTWSLLQAWALSFTVYISQGEPLCTWFLQLPGQPGDPEKRQKTFVQLELYNNPTIW